MEQNTKVTVAWSNGPTVREIAKKAGVSIATVSRVLNSKAINPKSKNQILVKKILEESAYIARKKNIVDSKNLLCIGNAVFDEQANNPALSLYMEYERELEKEAAASGFNLLISRTLDPMQKVDEMLSGMDTFSGVFFLMVAPVPGIKLPTIVLKEYYIGTEYCSVDDDYLAWYIETLSYLRGLGHSRIGFFHDYKVRHEHFNYMIHNLPGAYARSGLSFSNELLWNKDFPENNHEETIKEAVDYFLSIDKVPTALILTHDVYAPSFYSELSKRNIKIPDDISIVGYGGFPMSRDLTPALTTAAVNIRLSAKSAINIMRNKIDHAEKANVRIHIKPTLLEGHSCRRLE